MPTLPQPLQPTFTHKKARILDDLAIPDTEYSDKSPKGTVDAGIRDLIDEINGYEGLVTTSSCAGRVSVFVEGRKDVDEDGNASQGGSGGKGGGKWLFVSHERIASPVGAGLAHREDEADRKHSFTGTFNLTPPSTLSIAAAAPTARASRSLPRLIRLAFEPLILHVLCASLLHARPLLAAAIAAGFRESGVQSLKNLDDWDSCPMIAVRSAGLGFETVVGVVRECEDGEKAGEEEEEEGGGGGGGGEEYEAIVSEEYLEMMVRVANGRFGENEIRRERFREELKKRMSREMGVGQRNGHGEGDGWEDAETRRARKKEEGLRRQEESKRQHDIDSNGNEDGVSDSLAGLSL